MNRRGFLFAPAALAAPSSPEGRVYASGDGVSLNPVEYAALLSKIAGSIQTDNYSLGGVVEQLEHRMAALLGKEAAVWFPTGTLANHFAVRLQARAGRRVLVQEQSHLYNDSGDCAQTLSGLTLVPLAEGQATFTLEQAEAAAKTSASGRVLTPVSSLVIETPVRRKAGQQFSFDQMRKISAWAAANGIARHLDGARLFIESAFTGRDVKAYAALFDTVYVSMYKYFNAASGAILAGPKSLLAGAYHERRMFGSGLPGAWPFAAVTLHYLEGFSSRMAQAAETGTQVLSALESERAFGVERIANGTNVFRLRVPNENAATFRARADQAGLRLPAPAGGVFTLQINETWNRASAAAIVSRFRSALHG